MEEKIFRQTLKIFVVLFGVFVFGVLVGLSLADTGYIGSPTQRDFLAAQEQEEIRVDLAIDYGNGDTQSFPGIEIAKGASVFDVLLEVQEEKGVSIETRNFPGLGKFIEAIHGVHNTNTAYWQFWVNNEYSQVGAEQYILKNGDQVLWKRTSERPRE